jgi:hypothetical protein
MFESGSETVGCRGERAGDPASRFCDFRLVELADGGVAFAEAEVGKDGTRAVVGNYSPRIPTAGPVRGILST